MLFASFRERKPRGFTATVGIVVLVAVLVLSGCSGGGGSGQNPGSAGVTVRGTVLDFETGQALSGVEVSTSDGTTATTTADGFYSLTVPIANSRGVINATKQGYAPNSKIINDGLDISNYTLFLLPVEQSFTIDSSVANELNLDASSGGVSLPAGSLRKGDGSSPSGSVTVDLTSIDPRSAPDSMPGDFTTGTDQGSEQSIESFGAMNVQIYDESGDTLDLDGSNDSTVRIPVPENSTNPPTTIPLWYYDDAAGRWVEEGTATLVGVSPNWYYEGTVGHFSTWNADKVYDRVRVTGSVLDNVGDPVHGAVVTSTGQDYTGTHSSRSGSDGSFSVFVKAEAVALISATKDGRSSNTVTVTSSEAGVDIEMTEDLIIGLETSTSISLTWGENPRDLDSHLTGPGDSGTFQVFYGSRGSLTAAPYAQLDVDDVSGFGPEVITITRFLPGTYRYTVHHFSGTSTISDSPARVTLNLDGDVRVFNPPASTVGSGAEWTVFDLVVDGSGNVTVNAINTISQDGDYFASSSGTIGASRTIPRQKE
jgi:hypothetical protein